MSNIDINASSIAYTDKVLPEFITKFNQDIPSDQKLKLLQELIQDSFSAGARVNGVAPVKPLETTTPTSESQGLNEMPPLKPFNETQEDSPPIITPVSQNDTPLGTRIDTLETQMSTVMGLIKSQARKSIDILEAK
jgi:hypothetical protein